MGDYSEGKKDNFAITKMTAIYGEGKIVGFVPDGEVNKTRIQQSELEIKEGVSVLTNGTVAIQIGESALILKGGDKIFSEISRLARSKK